MKEDKRKIHLVRHGESTYNRDRRVQGNSPGIVLSETGVKQARLLGRRLEKLSFAEVFCSDAERAAETANIALGGASIRFMKELREISFGEWEGRLVSEIQESEPGMMEKWFSTPSRVKIEGAEDYLSFHDRVRKTMQRLIDTTSGDILVISHGGVICAWLTHILGMDPDGLWCFSLPNTSISTVVLDFRPRLRLLGDASHLDSDSLGFDGMPSVMS